MRTLTGLKPGDRVIVRLTREPDRVASVVAITATGRIKTSDGREFNPDGSIRPKLRRGHGHILPATPENLNPARVGELYDAIRRGFLDDSHRWSLAKLERVWAAMDANDEEPTT